MIDAAVTERSVVFVVDDDTAVQEALKDLLETVGLEARLFGSPLEFLRSERPDAPACLVLDVRMPDMSGLDFQRMMEQSNIQIPIVFITGYADVPMSVRAMKGGAIDFLTKPFRDQDLLEAIQRGIEKDRVRRRNAAVVSDLQQRFADLTQGERDVMTRVISGRLNKQIAGELGVSEITVKVRRANTMRKMQANSLAELIRMADKIGLSTESK
jgi:FixJ family two-component response regulator